MNVTRKTFFIETSRNRWIEDQENGVKPGILFDDNGTERVILMKSMCDESQTMKFDFLQLNKDNLGVWTPEMSKPIYAGYNSYVDSNGVVVPFATAHDSEKNLKPEYTYEYLFYVNLFGRNPNADKSIYDMIHDFIENRMSDGLQNYQIIR